MHLTSLTCYVSRDRHLIVYDECLATLETTESTIYIFRTAGANHVFDVNAIYFVIMSLVYASIVLSINPRELRYLGCLFSHENACI